MIQMPSLSAGIRIFLMQDVNAVKILSPPALSKAKYSVTILTFASNVKRKKVLETVSVVPMVQL